MDYISRVDVFESSQQLVEEVARVLRGERLTGVDDLMEVTLHQVQNHISEEERERHVKIDQMPFCRFLSLFSFHMHCSIWHTHILNHINLHRLEGRVRQSRLKDVFNGNNIIMFEMFEDLKLS